MTLRSSTRSGARSPVGSRPALACETSSASFPCPSGVPHFGLDSAAWLCCKGRRSRRMTIAHRFIGGCQGRGFNESVKRTTDDKPNANELFSRPLHGLDHIRVSKPSAKALDYFRSVRFADEDQLLLQQSCLAIRDLEDTACSLPPVWNRSE